MFKKKFRSGWIFWFLKIGLRKWIFLGVKKFFSWVLISKIGFKMNSRLITKHRAADPEIRFLTKSILKRYGYTTAMPPAWELSILRLLRVKKNLIKKSYPSSLLMSCYFKIFRGCIFANTILINDYIFYVVVCAQWLGVNSESIVFALPIDNVCVCV